MVQSLVGTRIRERREALGLKQAAVARGAGISPSYLNLIEHNRRGIAGKVLIDIARVLDISVAVLNEGADVALVHELQTAALSDPDRVEINRLEELIGRFPGWAGLIARLSKSQFRLERELDSLNDRLAHDPFLSESLHEVLSNVTAIRSISSILAQTSDIDQNQQSRFHRNLFEESQRLTAISQSLAAYFDQSSTSVETLSTPLDEFESFLIARKYHFSELEIEGASAIDRMLAQASDLNSGAAKQMAQEFLQAQVQRIDKMPLGDFTEIARQANFDPDQIAADFQISLPDVFYRLACQATRDTDPAFGLVACDLTGAIVFRKDLPGFPLPRYGAACPLWPLYQAIAQPHAPLHAKLETPNNEVFSTYAQCLPTQRWSVGGPQVLQSTMLIGPATDRTTAILPVGLNCRVCPRENCLARREASIHRDIV